MGDPKDAVRAFLERREATWGRLQRVNEALARWDEYEAAQTLPEEVRPRVEPPALSRAALKRLQVMLRGVLGELEELWELRNEPDGSTRRRWAEREARARGRATAKAADSAGVTRGRGERLVEPREGATGIPGDAGGARRRV